MINYSKKEEDWKDVKGYEGFYKISNFGRVKSLTRKVSNGKGGVRYQHERILKQGKTKDGYLLVVLRKNNKSNTQRVHGLVYETFYCKYDNKLQINHIDGDKENNCMSNLEVVTASENMRHACKKGLRHIKLTQKDADEICDIYKNTSLSLSEIGKLYKVSKQNIWSICKGKIWN